MTPSLASRADFLAAEATPFLRRISTAAFRSPLASVRAFLQSIKPAPVISRREPTLAAVISAIQRKWVSESIYGITAIVPDEPKLARSAPGQGQRQVGRVWLIRRQERRGRLRRRRIQQPRQRQLVRRLPRCVSGQTSLRIRRGPGSRFAPL